MPWYRVEVGRHAHRKIKRLARELDISRLHAVGLHDVLLSIVTEAGRGDGSLEGITAEDIATEADYSGDPNALLKAFATAGLIDERRPGKFFVHDYEQRAGSIKDSERMKKARSSRSEQFRTHSERFGTESKSVPNRSRTDVRTDGRTNQRTDGHHTESPEPAPSTAPGRINTDDVFLEFPVVGNSGPLWHLMRDKVAEYRASYPGVDIEREARAARQWCVDRPTQRKTPRGMPAFLSSWFQRAQNSGPPGSAMARTGSRPETAPRNLTAGERQIASARRLVEEAEESERNEREQLRLERGDGTTK